MIITFASEPIPFAKCSYRGLDSPSATLITHMAGVRDQNFDTILACFGPDIVPKIREEMADKEAFCAKIEHLSSTITSIRIVAMKEIDSDRRELKFGFGVKGEGEKMLLQSFCRFDDEWKFVGSTTDADW